MICSLVGSIGCWCLAHDEPSTLMRKKLGLDRRNSREPPLDTSSPRYLSGLLMGIGSGVVL